MIIKLKSLLLENIEDEVKMFNNTITSKYGQYVDQFFIHLKDGDIVLEFIDIKPQFRGRGFGSKIMKELVQFADSKQLSITLIPAPENYRSNSLNRLKTFYRKFGFVDSKRYPLEVPHMVRYPK